MPSSGHMSLLRTRPRGRKKGGACELYGASCTACGSDLRQWAPGDPSTFTVRLRQVSNTGSRPDSSLAERATPHRYSASDGTRNGHTAVRQGDSRPLEHCPRGQREGQKDKARTNLAARIARESARALAEHHLFAARWAEQLHPQAAAPAVTSDGATVELAMRNYARRLGTTAMGSRTELELLLDDTNYVILGDPGAGKTTTMRRLVQQVPTAPPANPTDPWDFAIVIVGTAAR